MPIYEYLCPVCGARFECAQHFSDPPLTTCPAGHAGVQRVYNPPSIIFKGSGFYTTDCGETRQRGDEATRRRGNGATR